MLQYLTFSTPFLGSGAFDNEETKLKYSHEIVLFGQRVEWLGGRHYDAEDLERHRMVGDVEMDRILDLTSGKNEVAGAFANTIEVCKKIYDEQQNAITAKDESNFSEEHRAMFEFYRHYYDQVPSWVDWDQIQRGIDVFISFSPVAGQSLFYLSLVPGFSIPKIAKVLEQTRYLVPPSTPEQVRHRLMDTGGFISSVMLPGEGGLSAASLRPGCKGWDMALQVRALHAKVRRSILLNKRIKWDVEKYGIPINQEDMAATLLAFSVNVLMGIQFVSGRELPLDTQQDYLALWRYIGWLLGIECDERETDMQSSSLKTCSDLVPLDPCGTRMHGHKSDNSIIHARASLESFIVHLMHPNKSSSRTAKHLLSIGGSNVESSFTDKQYNSQNVALLYRFYMCRIFIGGPLADALDLPKPNYHFKSICACILMFGVLTILRIYTLLTMISSWFRTKSYSLHLRMIQGFVNAWTEKNRQRMKYEAAKMNVGRKSFSFCDNRKGSSCPFALVMPPKSGISNYRSHCKHD